MNDESEPQGDMAPDGFWVRIMWFMLTCIVIVLFVWSFAYAFGQLWEYLQWGRT